MWQCTQNLRLLYAVVNRLHINTTALTLLNLTREQVNCSYIYVGPGRKWQPVKDDVTTLFSDYENSIGTSCKEVSSGREIFNDVIFFVEPPAASESSGGSRESVTKYSIVLFIIDSMSQMNFLRSLPRTLETVRSLGGDIFLGHHKIGLNSVPNVNGLLGVGCVPPTQWDTCKGHQVCAINQRFKEHTVFSQEV